MPKDPKKPVPAVAQLKKEAIVHRAQLRFEDEEAELEATYGDIPAAENTVRNKTEDQDDWEYLRSVAKVQFPEGAEHVGLSPQNRLVAMASCLGWPDRKIARASGLSTTTVARWLKRPDMKVFMDEFNLKRGADGHDVMTKFTELEYKAVSCVDKILSDKDNSDSAKRLKLDASKWVFERKRGKPNQPIEHRGDVIKQFINVMSKSGKDFSLDEIEEDEVFNESKETH